MNVGLWGSSMNKIRFYYNDFINWDILLVLDSFSFIDDGIHTLDNRSPDMPFDYVGQAGNDYSEDDYDYTGTDDFRDGHGFASWRLGWSCDVVYLFICFVIGMCCHST